MDLGTGDGSAVVRWARAHPVEAVLGIDADASRMREASARAARPARKGGLPNAWFVVAAAEALSTELVGCVDELRVVLPWGSLLRGVLGPEHWFLDAAGRVLRPQGELRMLLSVIPRDSVTGVERLDPTAATAVVERYRTLGWDIRETRLATKADVDASGSSWAKRLGIPQRRDAIVLVAARVDIAPSVAAVGRHPSAPLPR